MRCVDDMLYMFSTRLIRYTLTTCYTLLIIHIRTQTAIFSNQLKPVQTRSSQYKAVQTHSNRFKLVQTCSNLTHMSGNRPCRGAGEGWRCDDVIRQRWTSNRTAFGADQTAVGADQTAILSADRTRVADHERHGGVSSFHRRVGQTQPR